MEGVGLTATTSILRQRNARIIRIPAEVWADIFYDVHCFASDMPASFQFTFGDEMAANMKQMVSISHVCRTWRGSVLGSTRLWTMVDLRHEGAETFAIRSAQRPLRMTLFHDTHPRSEVPSKIEGVDELRWVRQHAGRVEELVLRTWHIVTFYLLAALGHDLPKLSILVLKPEWTRHELEGGQYAVPELNITSPNLRTLRLVDTRVDIDAFSNLTYLEIRDLVDFGYPTHRKLLGFLIRMPCLEYLHLVNLDFDFDFDLDVDPTSLGIVDFPCMKGLMLGALLVTKYLLDHIRIPASAPLLAGTSFVLEIDRLNGRLRFGTDIYANHTKPHLFVDEGYGEADEIFESVLPRIINTLDLSGISHLTIVMLKSEPEVADEWLELEQFLEKLPLLTSVHLILALAWLPSLLGAVLRGVSLLDSLWLECNKGPRPDRDHVEDEDYITYKHDDAGFGTATLLSHLPHKLKYLGVNFEGEELLEQLRGSADIFEVLPDRQLKFNDEILGYDPLPEWTVDDI